MGKYFDVSYMIQAFPQLLNYVHVTVLITVISAILGVIFRLYYSYHSPQEGTSIKPIIYCIYLLYARGTPFLVQLFLIYFGVPEIMSHMGLNMKKCTGPRICVCRVYIAYCGV